MNILNRKAHFNYTIIEEVEAGIVLVGSEVKSIRDGKATINEAFVIEKDGELFLSNSHVSEYKGANRFNHEPNRLRKLLLHRKQVRRIIGQITKESFTAVPLKLFFNKKNFLKVLIGVGKGKKLYDKRETIKKRDDARRAARGED